MTLRYRKKILLISYLYYPSSSVGARRLFNLNKYLLKNNILVDVLTVNENKYTANDPELTAPVNMEHVYRTKSIGPIKKPIKRSKETFIYGFWRRLCYVIHLVLRTLLFPDEYIGWLPTAAIKAIRLHREKKYDWIIASAMPWTNFLIADVVHMMYKIPLVLDYRDPWTVWDDASYGSPLIKVISKWYEKGLLQRADAVIVNTYLAERMYVEKHGDMISQKIHVVYNGFDSDMHNTLENIEVIKHPKFRMIHTGSFYGGRRISSLLKAIYKLKVSLVFNSSNFEFITYGVLQSSDSNLKRELKLEDLVVESDFVPYRESLLELRNATVNFLVIGNEHSAAIPAKLFDYLMAERPILAIGPAECEAKSIIKKYNYGNYCDLNDVNDIENGLNNLFDMFMSGKLSNKLTVPDELNVEYQMNKVALIVNAMSA